MTGEWFSTSPATAQMCQLEVLPFVVNCLRAVRTDSPLSSHVMYFSLQRIFVLY